MKYVKIKIGGHLKALNFLVLTLILLLVFPFLGKINQAKAVNYSYLISDAEFTNWQAISANDIQLFLNTRGGTRLRTFSEGGRTAAQIIADAARSNGINPYVILATIQKEESIVDSNYNFDFRVTWAMGYGVCDNCSLDDPRVSKYRGFTNQIDHGAWQLKHNYNYWAVNGSAWHVGKTMVIDGLAVRFGSRGTSSLYRYTPHLHGNMNFVNIYNSYKTFKYSYKFDKSSYKADLIKAKLAKIAKGNQKKTAKVIDKTKLTKIGNDSSANATFNAQFINKVEPGILSPGQKYTIYAYFKNTGSIAWQNSGSNPVYLGNSDPRDRSSAFTGGNVRWRMLNSSVTPGRIGVFSIQITAPSSTGAYTEKFQPLSEGATWFGNEAVFNFNVNGAAVKTIKK